jgi:NAD(P)-dependent dehydrogenase (short-subunit alcohol dehydrogenase family)
MYMLAGFYHQKLRSSSMKFDLLQNKNTLIIGGGHGIGLALVKQLLKISPDAKVVATYRVSKNAMELLKLHQDYPERLKIFMIDPTSQTALSNLSIDLLDSEKFDLIVNSVGLLHNDELSPEKSVRSFSTNHFMEVMRVNTVVTPLVAKYFESFLRRDFASALVSISAKVGSIQDNRIGGWHSYRASKAALNMLVKNISIEFAQKRNNCIVLALHPGTTDTNLSKPFTSNTSYKVHTPEETAKNILNVINHRELSDSGKFLSWDGAEIEW